jgi:DNA sulfur modification protein DndD
MIRAEFLRFVESLSHISVSQDEWRLLNIIKDELESIVPLGAAAGKRSRYLVHLAYPAFDSLPSQPPNTTSGPSSAVRRLSRLDALAVGPFRGFGTRQEFDLANQIILLYGPNGTGKSSFFEALEYCLLGTVNDCSTKRIGIQDYLKNARTRSFEKPELTGIYGSSEPEAVIANEDLYRFCFVEKNRIDDFSRIASFTSGQQERIIAALFGIGGFDSFVTNFNDSIDNYLEEDSAAARDLLTLETSLVAHREIVASKGNTLKALDEDEALLTNSYQQDLAYSAFVEAIGSQDSGAIKALTDQLAQPLKTTSGVIRVGLLDAVAGVRTAWQAYAELQSAKQARASEVSYRDLYMAVLALESTDSSVCPACETPLFGVASVVSNPFDKARRAVEALSELAEIERNIETSKRQLTTRSNGLLAQLANLESHLTDAEKQNVWAIKLNEAILAGREDAATGWWQQICGVADDTAAESWDFLTGCLQRIERADELVSEQQRNREKARNELSALSLLRDKSVQLATRRSDTERGIREAEAALDSAETSLTEARRKAELERQANAVRQRICSAYSTVLSRLQGYRDDLPATLLADLSTTVIELYSGFNRGDPVGDLMADLKLPLRSGDRIMFSYASSPQTYFDALHVLSEGHIRCLGLAILLAKNVRTNCPVLIFDDPVNAIDSDHREGIRLTLFEDSFLSGRQILLTCHGEEFTKDIQNLLGAAGAGTTCKGYTFLPHLGDNQLRVEVMATKNHIASARTGFERNEYRSCLTDARRGLEWVANTIWTKVLPGAGVSGLTVKLSKPNAKPELFNVVQSLVKEIGKNTFVSSQKTQLIAGLNAILGLNQNGREWEYLNKGTHEEEDRQEFDRGTVRKVVEALENLDRAITACRSSQVVPPTSINSDTSMDANTARTSPLPN